MNGPPLRLRRFLPGPPFFNEVLVGDMEKDPLVYVAVEGRGADGGGEALRSGRRQRRRRRKPLPPVPLPVRLNAKHFLLQEIGVGVVVPDFQGPSLGGLVVFVDLLGFIRRVSYLVL